MGFKSWHTADTDRSISNRYSEEPTFKVTMMDNEGNTWTEEKYEGYGEFGGKDYFVLLAEMNGGKTKEDGLSIYNGIYGIKNIESGEVLLHGEDFSCWNTDTYDGRKSPYELIFDGNWVRVIQKLVDIDYPLLLEDAESTKEWYNRTPKECEYNGYFYNKELSEEERLYGKR